MADSERRVEACALPASRRIARVALRVLALLALCSAGCGPPSGGVAGAPPAPLLYVANVLDGTITRVDAGGDRVVGAALPAGPAPWQMAVGSSGNLLVLTTDVRTSSKLTYVAPSAGVWRARPLVLERGARPLFLAGDGKRYAIVAYALPLPGRQAVDPGDPGCRLALVDLRTGAIARVHTPCADQESITGLALETTAAGTTAYLGLSRWYEEKGRRQRSRSGQVVALDVETGVAWATQPMAGWPQSVFVAPAPGGLGRRLYCLAIVPGLNWDGREDHESWLSQSGGQVQLLGLDPATLSPRGEREWRSTASSLTVAPDGNNAYALTSMGSQLVHVDLATGAATPLVTLPSFVLGGLAVTDQHIYVTNVLGSEVWVLDRDRGRLVKTVQVGRHPIGIQAAGAPK